MTPVIRKAPPLAPGSQIGIVAPSSAPREEAGFQAGVRSLERDGFTPHLLRPLGAPYGYLSAPDQVRLDEFNHFLRSSDVDALFCARGGYGALRILDGIDFEAAAARPRLLVGYSDITALQFALYVKAGWQSVSGPLVTEWAALEPRFRNQFLALAAGEHPRTFDHPAPLEGLTPGEATGRLMGGNLSMIAKLVGTPYLPDLTDSILFLEEVGEPPYRIDGLLAQLRLAGVLDQVAGILLGAFTEAEDKPGKPTLTLDQVFKHYFGGLGVPVAQNLAYGHLQQRLSLPIGPTARLVVSDGDVDLQLLEQVVDC